MHLRELLSENFADGKKPGRKGLAKRSGVDCSKSVTDLRKIAANSSGEKQRMAHWCANMKSGRSKANEVAEDDLEEGWRDTLANVALAGGIAAAGTGGMMAKQAVSNYFGSAKEPTASVQQVQQAPKADVKKFVPQSKQQAQKKLVVKPVTDNPLEIVLLKVAKSQGLSGEELAAFMAQCAHESHDFQSLKEYGGSLDFRKYDPKYGPKKARALGNKYIGDGAKFKGRGFIHITGRYNYKRAGEALGLPLEKHPELVEKPEIAAKVAVWFWKHRVQPNVENFNDVNQVTKPINPGMKGLQDRKENFKTYMQVALTSSTPGNI